MRALLSRRPGGPETLELDEIPEPVAGSGQVRVAVRACGVNFPDLLIIQDLYQVKPPRPFAPGGEISGIVDALGTGVEGLRVGDRVLMSPVQGGMAQKVVGPAQNCWKIPDAMPFDEAAALLLPYGTSQHALKDRAQLKAARRCSYSAPRTASASPRWNWARPWALASSPRHRLKRSSRWRANMALMRPCNTRRLRSTKPLRALTDHFKSVCGANGAQVIFDPVGGDYTEAALMALYLDGRFNPAVTERFPLQRGMEAIARLGTRDARGKVVVMIE